MPFQPTVFGQLMKSIPRRVFEAAAEGRAKWALSDWAHLVALVMAQIAGIRSLRDLERLLAHHRGALSHLAVNAVRRSTLADANRTRPTEPFEAVAAYISCLIARHAPGLGREALRLIDATRIHAGQTVREWALDGALKLHVMLDPILQRTVCFAVTSARVNDITAAKLFPIEAGLTYVFDRGYYDFGFWAKLHGAGCRFVTRLKKNTPISGIKPRRVPKRATHILGDRVGWLPSRLCHSRQNPFQARIRIITVEISSGRIIEVITNDLKTSAVEIARLYKMRWDIELFFKWIKQNLKIQHFLGASRNAVTLQIIAALIGFLLVRLAQLLARSGLSLQEAFRIISVMLMMRRPLHDLLHPPTPPVNHTDPHGQLALAIA
jgi:hypothetical protein